MGLILLLAMVLTMTTSAQQPMPMAPTYPAINPANAKLEQTLGGLDGPGVALVAGDEIGGVLALGEGRALHYWPPDLLLGVRSSDAGGYALRQHEAPVLDIAKGGKVVASAGVDGKIVLWALPKDKARLTLENKAPVRALAVSADGKLLASTGEDGVVQFWETEKGQPLGKATASQDWILALTFSPDGKTLYSGGYDGKWRSFEVPSGKKLQEVEAQAPAPKDKANDANIVMAIAAAPDGKSLAVAGSNGQIYQFQTDGKLIRALTGHTAGVAGLAFHPSGSLLVSAGKDRTVRLWNPSNGQAIKTLEGHSSWVQDVAFYHQGTRVASVSADRTVKLWDISDPTKK